MVGGERRTIRLGNRVGERPARRFADNLSDLAACRAIGSAPDTRLVTWLAAVDDRMHARLVEIGLTNARVRAVVPTLGELWDRFTGAKAVKPATSAVFKRVRASMEDHFGTGTPIDVIGPEQAEGWVKALSDGGLAQATRSKLIHIAKALFRRAVLWGLLTSNPFGTIKPGPQTNPLRQAYIPLADLDRIIDTCADHEWRCIFGLARLAGLRCPSEISSLRWGDVDFDDGRLTVTSPKTEHHEGGATRIVPIVPSLHTMLMDAFTAMDPGTVYVVPRLRDPDTNLRTHSHRILTRAGIQPPPKLFVNLRASCATDWAREHGGHVAAKWCGHSPTIALKHYAQVRPEDFAKATGKVPPADAGSKKHDGEVAHGVARNRPEQGGTGRNAVEEDALETPDFQADSGELPSVPESGSGRNRARTCDLSYVTAAL